MALLNYLCLLLFVFSVVKGDINNSDENEPKDVFRQKLEKKLNDIKFQNEVTDDKPQTTPVPNNNKAVVVKTNYPLSFRSDPPQCPNFSDVLSYVKKSIGDIKTLFTAFMNIFAKAYSDPNNQCHISINPISTLKCFLRVFVSGYKNVSDIIVDAGSLKSDLFTLFDHYKKYRSQCNNNWGLRHTLQLADLLKYLEEALNDF